MGIGVFHPFGRDSLVGVWRYGTATLFSYGGVADGGRFQPTASRLHPTMVSAIPDMF